MSLRFSVPRSTSPSPVRRSHRRSTFGIPSSWSDDESDGDSDAESSQSSSSDSFCYASESEVPPPPPKPRRERSAAEQYAITDAVASIRLRVNHFDPYEELGKEIKQDALRVARLSQSQSRTHKQDVLSKSHSEEVNRRAALHKKQMDEVQAQLSALALQREAEEKQLKEEWAARNRRLWERIEAVIKAEEDKVRTQLEAERKRREEEERQKREDVERKRREEEEHRKQKEREEEERKKAEEEAREAERRREEEVQRLKEQEEQEGAEEQQRKELGYTTPLEDWKKAREILIELKKNAMKPVKENRQAKPQWSAARREIRPKIGQITNDPQEIARITSQIITIVRGPPHSKPVYNALLSSLAKAILLQAETEVTAEKRAAYPLAQVTVNLLTGLERFPHIFWARLVQRAGGWAVPAVIPNAEPDGTSFTSQTKRKAMGYRGEETRAEFAGRVAGVMRLYFVMMGMPSSKPLNRPFRTSRLWTWFARLMGQPQLLEDPVAPEIMHVALDVAGPNPYDIWGQQWVKLLSLLYEGVTVGLSGEEGKLIGGKTPEGTAARMRVQLEIERQMGLIVTRQ